MKGKAAAILNALSLMFSGILLSSSINYVLGIVGVSAAGFNEWKKGNYNDHCHFPDEGLDGNVTYAYPDKDKIRTYVNVELAGAFFAIIVAITQLVVCLAAISSTQIINWVIWIIAHFIGIIFSLLAFVLVISMYGSLQKTSVPLPENKYKEFPGPYHASFGMKGDPLEAAVIYYCVVIFLDFVFCIVGFTMMILKRHETLERKHGILEDEAEGLVEKVSSRLLGKKNKENEDAAAVASSATATAAVTSPTGGSVASTH